MTTYERHIFNDITNQINILQNYDIRAFSITPEYVQYGRI